MTVVNLTSHKIVVETADGHVEFVPSGNVARVASHKNGQIVAVRGFQRF